MANDRIERLLDRQDIIDCLARMSRGTDRFDRDLFVSAFHEDAVIAAGPFVGGPSDLYDWSAEFQELAQTGTFHYLLNHSFDFDGDSAHVETYYLFVGLNRDETNILAGGRYIDRFDRREGVWRLAVRNNCIEWSSIAPALANPLAAVADINANGAASRSTDDPSYRRPFTNLRAPFVPPGIG